MKYVNQLICQMLHIHFIIIKASFEMGKPENCIADANHILPPPATSDNLNHSNMYKRFPSSIIPNESYPSSIQSTGTKNSKIETLS